MSEPTPDLDTPDMDIPDPTLDGPEHDHDHEADYDRAVQYAGDGEVTTDARGNTVLADGVDPLAVIERAEHGIDWPDGAAPMPAGFTSLTPAERTDWLIAHDWPGVITATGYPVADDPWGDPTSPPTGPESQRVEPAMPTPKGRPMGGPEDARRASKDAEDAGKHGLVKGIGGGSGKKKKRAPLGAKIGRGDGGTGGGGLRSLFTFNVNVMAGAFSGWLSPKTDVGSGNSGALIAAGKRH